MIKKIVLYMNLINCKTINIISIFYSVLSNKKNHKIAFKLSQSYLFSTTVTVSSNFSSIKKLNINYNVLIFNIIFSHRLDISSC